MDNTNNNQSNYFLTAEDYFNLGKSDAWMGTIEYAPTQTENS